MGQDLWRKIPSEEEMREVARLLDDGAAVHESEVERKERENNEINNAITPELLRFFTPKDARDLIRTFRDTPSASFDRIFDLQNINPETVDYLTKEIKGENIIELGSNANTTYQNIFMGMGAKSYEFADPKFNQDGLTLLSKQPDESAIVCSFALFSDAVLYGHPGDHFNRYITELINQIYRVTPKNGISIHGLEYVEGFQNGGFAIDNSAPTELKIDAVGGILKLRVFRKQAKQ